MTQVTTLAAEKRERAGKGTASALRREGKIPAVIYGDNKTPLSISMELKQAESYALKSGFFTKLFDIVVDSTKHRVLARDVQYHPVTDRVLHIDFLRVAANTKVRVNIPLAFVNQTKSPGIKRGGALNIVHHQVEALCIPTSIPEKINVSLEGLPLGATLSLQGLKLPEGVTLVSGDKDYTIASIAVPSSVRSALKDASKDPASSEPAAAAAAPASKAAAKK